MRVETDVSEQSLTPEERGARVHNFLVPPTRGVLKCVTVTEISPFRLFCENRHIFLTKRTYTSYIYISLNLFTMATIDLKALRFPFKDPKFIFFTDFDGTITLKDSNDFMVGLRAS